MAIHSNSNLGGLGLDSDLYAQLAQRKQAELAHNHPSPLPHPPNTITMRAREMFLKRLGGLRAEYKLDLSEYIACHVHADEVYVFYFLKGKAGYTQEPIDLFPSDGLIAQFRMVLV